MQGGPVDEFLDAAVERSGRDQLEVEVSPTLEDRVQPCLTGDDGEEPCSSGRRRLHRTGSTATADSPGAAVADMRGQRGMQHLDGLQPEGVDAFEDPLA
jgi:hypothetical protein